MKENELEQEEIKTEEQTADTQTASPEVSEQQETVDEVQTQEPVEEPVQEEVAVDEAQPQPRMFTQEELNEIVGKTRIEARDKANASYYERYGVAGDDELNDLVGRGQAYSVLDEKYKAADSELKELRIENALLKSGIVPNRYEDAKLIITGKGLEVNEQTIAQELTTHPEWAGEVQQPQPQPTPVIQQPVAQKVFTREMAEAAANTPSQSFSQPQENVIKRFGNPVAENNSSDEDDEARALKFMGL